MVGSSECATESFGQAIVSSSVLDTHTSALCNRHYLVSSAFFERCKSGANNIISCRDQASDDNLSGTSDKYH